MTGLPAGKLWVPDFEYRSRDGRGPEIVCMVAQDLRSGATVRCWRDELGSEFPGGWSEDETLIAYAATAELSCFIELGWPIPSNVIDLYVEFRALTNGRYRGRRGLLSALEAYGEKGLNFERKQEMRSLIIAGGPWDAAQRGAILDYCNSDVEGTVRLFHHMREGLELGQALLRGRYLGVVSRMEARGVPLDPDIVRRLSENWDAIRDLTVERVNADYGVFEGRQFRNERWLAWCAERRIPWPLIPDSGRARLDADTFKAMRHYPGVERMRQTRRLLSSLRAFRPTLGPDGRNRAPLHPFGTKTGRNAPKTAGFIFGYPAWTRGAVAPVPGTVLLYADYEQQELGIAGALSGDAKLMEAYASGDPYLAFGKQAGLIPTHGTKESHPRERDACKQCCLGVLFGMGPVTLAARLATSESRARDLLASHRRAYPRFWAWSDAAVDCIQINERLESVFGWPIHMGGPESARSYRNFPMQANGAEVLRIACCLLEQEGLAVCAPVHDAVLLELSDSDIQARVKRVEEIMVAASEEVLGGFPLRVQSKLVTRVSDMLEDRTRPMWREIMSVLRTVERRRARAAANQPSRG